jgi:hypothetical protein
VVDDGVNEQVIEGVGFGVTGFEENSLLLVDGDGGLQLVQVTSLMPENCRCDWVQIESLMDGYDPALSAEEKTSFGPNPRACRVRITVHAEPLSEVETEQVLKRVRDRRARDRSAP